VGIDAQIPAEIQGTFDGGALFESQVSERAVARNEDGIAGRVQVIGNAMAAAISMAVEGFIVSQSRMRSFDFGRSTSGTGSQRSSRWCAV
jgi:hypothetical protein